MTDGSWGYTCAEAVKAVLGDKYMLEMINSKRDAMTPEMARKYVMREPEEIAEATDAGYSECARQFARVLLIEANKNKEVFLKDSKKFADKVYGNLPKDSPAKQITGFMFGWAVNTVRYILGEKPIQNPAIVEIK